MHQCLQENVLHLMSMSLYIVDRVGQGQIFIVGESAAVSFAEIFLIRWVLHKNVSGSINVDPLLTTDLIRCDGARRSSCTSTRNGLHV